MPKNKFFRNIRVNFDTKVDRKTDAVRQAKEILDNAKKILAESDKPKMVGITYSANKVQSDQIHAAYNTEKATTGISGDNQAMVMAALENLLKTDYQELKSKFRILPVTTMENPGGIGETKNEWLKEDFDYISNFVNDDGIVLGWQNQDTVEKDKKLVAIGGGISATNKTFTEKHNAATQAYFRALQVASNNRSLPPSVNFREDGVIQLGITQPKKDAVPAQEDLSTLNKQQLLEKAEDLSSQITAQCLTARDQLELFNAENASFEQITKAIDANQSALTQAKETLDLLKKVHTEIENQTDPNVPSFTVPVAQNLADDANTDIANTSKESEKLLAAHKHAIITRERAQHTTEQLSQAVSIINSVQTELSEIQKGELSDDAQKDAITALQQQLTKATEYGKEANAEYLQAKDYLNTLENTNNENPKLKSLYNATAKEVESAHTTITTYIPKIESNITELGKQLEQPQQSTAKQKKAAQKPERSEQEIIAIVKQVDERFPSYKTLITHYHRQMHNAARSHDKAQFNRLKSKITAEAEQLKEQLAVYKAYINNDYFRDNSLITRIKNSFRSNESIKTERDAEVTNKLKQAEIYLSVLDKILAEKPHEKVIFFADDSRKVIVDESKENFKDLLDTATQATIKELLGIDPETGLASAKAGELRSGGENLDAHFGNTASVKHSQFGDLHAISVLKNRDDNTYVADLSFYKTTTQPDGSTQTQPIRVNEMYGLIRSQGHPDDPFVRIPKDEILKWAKITVDDFLANAPDPSQAIQLRGNMDRQCAKAIILYCQLKGHKYVNRTRHDDIKPNKDKRSFYKEKYEELFNERTLSEKQKAKAQADTQYPTLPKQPKAEPQQKEEPRSSGPGKGRSS